MDKNKKKFTPGITERFLQVEKEVIATRTCRTRKEFAESVGEHQQNLSIMEKGIRAPTLEVIAMTCELYGYNPTWVLLGTGQKKKGKMVLDPTAIRLSKIENQVEEILKNVRKAKPAAK